MFVLFLTFENILFWKMIIIKGLITIFFQKKF